MLQSTTKAAAAVAVAVASVAAAAAAVAVAPFQLSFLICSANGQQYDTNYKEMQ